MRPGFDPSPSPLSTDLADKMVRALLFCMAAGNAMQRTVQQTRSHSKDETHGRA